MRSPRGQPEQVPALVDTSCCEYTWGPKFGLLIRYRCALFVLATGALFQPSCTEPAGGAALRWRSVKSPFRFVAETVAPVVTYGQLLLAGQVPLQAEVA